MSRNSRILAGLLIAVILIVLGGYREMFFININEQIAFNDGVIERYRVLDMFSFLRGYENHGLEDLKWILTIAFSLLFLAIGVLAMRYILLDKVGVLWLLIAYGLAFVLSAVFFIGGRYMGDATLGYTVSRKFMGALQSPFILMLIIAARRLMPR